MFPVRQTWSSQGSLQMRSFATSGPAFKSVIAGSMSKKARQALRESRQQAKKAKLDQSKKKVKKSGMTHLSFKDAVRVLRSDTRLPELSSLGVESLDAANLTKEDIVTYSETALPLMEGMGLFKKYQHHELFEKPISLISENTMWIQNLVKNMNKTTKDNRHFLLGEKGVGKSTLFAQAHAIAMSHYKEDVVLLHFSELENAVNGTSDYLFNPKTGLYQQPMFTKRWIGRTRFVNEKVFKKMPLSKDLDVSTDKSNFKLKKDTHTVYDLLLRSRDFTKASSALEVFIEQLQHHSEKFPVLCTLDNFNGLLEEPYTKYHHPDFRPIHLTEFEMGNFFLNLINGEVAFKRGAVFAAESGSLSKTKTLTVGLGIDEYDPYAKKSECDRVVAERLLVNGGASVYKLQNLTPTEARKLVLFYGETGALSVRDYPYKVPVTMPDDTSSVSQFKPVGALPLVKDAEAQKERLIDLAFNISQGNPGYLLKAAVYDC